MAGAEEGTFPPEIWHNICSSLDYAGVCKATSASFERVRCLAKNPRIAKGVKQLTFEAFMIRHVCCIAHFERHAKLLSISATKPEEPTEKSDRALRLYGRQKTSYDRELQAKYETYKLKLEDQSQLEGSLDGFLSKSIQQFTNLEQFNLKTEPACPHYTSARFSEEFGQYITIPYQGDPGNSVWQLKLGLIKSLEEVNVRCLSPSFFDSHGPHDGDWLTGKFSGLKRINLTFGGMSNSQATSRTSPHSFETLKNGRLARALGAAHGLTSLNVEFAYDYRGSDYACRIKDVLGQNAWPELTTLSIEFVSCDSADEYVRIMTSQPKLRVVNNSLITLIKGQWVNVIKKLKNETKFREFWLKGFIEDEERGYPMGYLHRGFYMEDRELDVAEFVNEYVTGDEMALLYDEEYDDPNPLVDFATKFGSEEDVQEEYAEMESELLAMMDRDESEIAATSVEEYDTEDSEADSDSMPGLDLAEASE